MEWYLINNKSGELIQLYESEKWLLNKDEFDELITAWSYPESQDICIIEIKENNLYIQNSGLENLTVNNIQIGFQNPLILKDNDNIIYKNSSFRVRIMSLDESSLQNNNDHIDCSDFKEDSENGKTKCTGESPSNIEDKLKLLINYDMDSYPSYKFEMLKLNNINAFLNFTYLSIKDRLQVTYDLDGFCKLDEYIKSSKFQNHESAIIIFNLINKLESLNEYLINYSDIELNINNLYINSLKLEVKFILKQNKVDTIKLQNNEIKVSQFDILGELITLIEEINNLRPNNYLNYGKSKILNILDQRAISLENLSKIILEEERQNKLEDQLFSSNSYSSSSCNSKSIEDDAKNFEFPLKIQSKVSKENLHKAIKEADYELNEEYTEITVKCGINKLIRNESSLKKILIGSQVGLILIFAFIYLKDYLNTFDLLALAIIVLPIDFWILKRYKIL